MMVNKAKGEAMKTALYRVTRFCCTSGLCIDCHARGNHGDRAKRARVIHAEDVSRELAARMIDGFHQYDAQSEPMSASGFAQSAALAKDARPFSPPNRPNMRLESEDGG